MFFWATEVAFLLVSMRVLNIRPTIFKDFPEVKTVFAVGGFDHELGGLEEGFGERQILLEELGISGKNIKVLNQVHGDKVLSVTKADSMSFFDKDLPSADGMYTAEPAVYLGMKTADCLPILFYNKQARVVAVVHAGWQGTVQKIVQRAVHAISEEFACPLRDFYFYFGQRNSHRFVSGRLRVLYPY